MTCPLGTLAAGASVPVTIVVRPGGVSGVAVNASVASGVADPVGANNGFSHLIAVLGAPAGVPVWRYRLYNTVTKEHHYTTDLNEYNTLVTYVGLWVGEGAMGKVLDNPGSFGGVEAVPYYRLYNAATQFHHWTTDANEYYTLKQFPGWTGEGVDGYLLPVPVAGTTALYRLLYPFTPGLHHWTTDLNEYQVLQSAYGWTGEGIAGYLIQ